MVVGAIDVTGFVGQHETHERGERELKQGERSVLASSCSFQVFYTLLEAPHLLFDNPKFDIECFVKLHKSINVVIDLIEAVFHVGETFPQLFYNLHVARMK
jgi:hypothetical protein